MEEIDVAKDAQAQLLRGPTRGFLLEIKVPHAKKPIRLFVKGDSRDLSALKFILTARKAIGQVTSWKFQRLRVHRAATLVKSWESDPKEPK